MADGARRAPPLRHGAVARGSVAGVTRSLDLDDATCDPLDVARAAAEDIAARTGVAQHDVAVVLGSGWGTAADLIGETVAEVPAAEITGFSSPALAGHVGSVRSVRITGTPAHALVIGARTHLYEGRGVRRVVHPIRTAAATGARTLILTNGCGSLEESWGPGTPVLIADHINLTGTTPVEGATFVDLTDLYSERLRQVARAVDPALPDGVYVQFRGPQYETPAEAAWLGRHGDVVGMSTAPEVRAAARAGASVCLLSLCVNRSAAVGSHEEVLATAARFRTRIGAALAAVLAARWPELADVLAAPTCSRRRRSPRRPTPLPSD